jgi:hypothetical protein
MSVVTIAEAWPAAGRPFTVAELDRMPDDGRRYELLDGVLIVSPRPVTGGCGNQPGRAVLAKSPNRPASSARHPLIGATLALWVP